MKKIHDFFLKLERQLFNEKWIGSPEYEVIRFTAIYLFVGLAWITTSDDLLAMMVKDIDLLVEFQTAKGWFYVFASAALFASILAVRLKRNKELNDRILYHQSHDELTQLPNRRRLSEIIDKRIQKNPKRSFALISLDIDDFATVNELLGYSIGDALLIDLTKDLSQRLGPLDTLARSGTGFIITYDLSERNQIQLNQNLNGLLSLINQERIIEDQSIFITSSIGVSIYPKDGLNFNELYKAADTAMHHLKGISKNSYNFYTEDYHNQRMDRIRMVNELRKALENKEIYLVYQPVIDMRNDVMIGYEALLRWDSSLFGKVAPDVFITVAETTNLISALEEFVFESCFNEIKRHAEIGIELMLSINLSSKGLVDISFIHTIERLLKTTQIVASNVQIEITETAIIENFDLAKRNLMRLKQLGFTIALDDFGTGYSSLTYLHQLPIDTMKIDRTFALQKGQGKQHEILSSIIDLGHKLKLKIISEGIETDAQKQFFIELGCVYGQGYFFGKPNTLDTYIKKD
jgi:diguanylate cyclase (GGDEF)-like protein